MKKTYSMPVEPFREILERAMFERQAEGIDPRDRTAYQNLGLLTPLEQVTEVLAEKLHVKYESAYRNLYRILNGTDRSRGKVYEVKTISLDWADAIACSFGGGLYFWRTDPRVSDLYEAIGQ